jgi:hypothetical protein
VGPGGSEKTVFPSEKIVPRPPRKKVPPTENTMMREMERLPLEKMGPPKDQK